MLKLIRSFSTVILVVVNVFRLHADDGKYLKYQQILQEKNDTLKCRHLITYAKAVKDSLHDYNFALLIYEKVADLIKQKPSASIELRLNYNWGYAYYDLGKYEEADKLFEKALAAKILDKHSELRATILNIAAANLQHMLVFKRALNYYNEALEIYTQMNNVKSKGTVYMNMANIYVSAGNFTQADTLVIKAIKMFQQQNMLEDYGIMLSNRAFIKSRAGQPDTAVKLLIRALKLPLSEKERGNGMQVKMYMNLGTYYGELKNWDSCFYFINKGKQVSDSLGLSEQYDGSYYYFMGFCYDSKNDLDKAVYYYKRALKIKTGIAGYKYLYENIADIYFKHKQYDSAFFYKEEALRFNDSLYKSELNEHMTFENKRIEILEQDYRTQLRATEQEHALGELEKKNYLFLSVIVLLITCVVLLFLYFRQYNLKVKKENLQSELDFLKAQLNPHFLFNSINNIYVLLDENKEKASDILLKFSELMRYQLYECNVDAIRLDKELQFLGNYIEFEKLRYSTTKILVEHTIENIAHTDFMIAPLLLQPFIENAFKHTPKKKNQQSHISIQASITGNQLLFTVSNTLSFEKVSELPGGIGLKNVKKRLKLLYPGRHDLNITQTDQLYCITLKLTLTHD